MRHLSIDIETFSSEPIQKTGLYKYVQSPDFQVLLLAYSMDGEPVKMLDLTQTSGRVPDWLFAALLDADIIKHAYNAAFEWYCLSKHFGMELPIEQWRCTRVHGLYCGYPGALGKVAAVMGLPEDKQKDKNGAALIRYFCVPCEPTQSNGGRTRNLPHHAPDRWLLFQKYCCQDVVTEMEIERRLSPWQVPDAVQAQWVADMKISTRGVMLDMALIDGALSIDSRYTGDLTREAKELTGLANPNSRAQLLDWLQKQGLGIPDLRAQTIADTLEDPNLLPNVRRVLEIRQGTSKTSVKKFDAMKTAVCADGKVRGLLQFYGANRTGRWSGQNIQPQNLPRTYIDKSLLPMTRELAKAEDGEALQMLYGSAASTLSQLIRTAFIPSPGNLFVDADFSAIEARVIAWLSGEQWRLDVFRSHGKIYEASAAAMFGVPIDTIAKGKENYALRAKGKIAELALGYGGSTGALINMGALRMGLSEDELPDIVSRWRGANQRIRQLWYALEGAALDTLRTGQKNAAGHCVFSLEGDGQGQLFLTVLLPSGRKLFYAQPFLTRNKFDRESIGYWGVNQSTKRWEKQETYSGKLTENITQAIARDCLAENLLKLEAAGFPVVFHIHDEVVIDIPEDHADLDAVTQIMSQPISWAPDLPLAADGWIGEYFTKD